MLMQIAIVFLIIAVGAIVALSGAMSGGFLTTFFIAFGLFVVVALGAAMVAAKKKNTNNH
jgi:hypothetical protein